MNIKKGALVKAWDDDASEFRVGYYQFKDDRKGDYPPHLVDGDWFKYAVELPPELAKQLEDLQ